MNIDEKNINNCVIFIAYIWKMAYRNTNNPFDRVVSDIINIITIFLCKKIKLKYWPRNNKVHTNKRAK